MGAVNFAEGASCCSARPEQPRHTEKVQQRRLTCNEARAEGQYRGPDYTQEESLELEWAIVAASIAPTELQALRELLSAVEDCTAHPACRERPLSRQPQTLLRFLRGREGDVGKAEKMFRDSLNWRASFGVDEKVHGWHEELKEGRSARAKLFRTYGTDAELCMDKEGVPIWLMRFSVADPAGMLREVGPEALLVHSLGRMEATHAHLRRAMFKRKALVSGCVQVIDVGDYGQHGVPNWWARMYSGFRIGSDAFRIFDANYPETTRKVFIVRMGRVTHSIYRMALPLIPERTRRKQRMFGAAAAEWLAELRAELPESGEAALPAFLRCDSGAAFGAALPRGGLVPVGGGAGAKDLVLAPATSPCPEDAGGRFTVHKGSSAAAGSSLGGQACVLALAVSLALALSLGLPLFSSTAAVLDGRDAWSGVELPR